MEEDLLARFQELNLEIEQLQKNRETDNFQIQVKGSAVGAKPKKEQVSVSLTILLRIFVHREVDAHVLPHAWRSQPYDPSLK